MVDVDAATNVVSGTVIDACLAVHRALGPGYLESVYEEALSVELQERHVPFVRQHPLSIVYRERVVGTQRLDLLVGGSVVVELKAVETMNDLHLAQVLSYLRVARLRVGLLINFNVPLVRSGIRRVVAAP